MTSTKPGTKIVGLRWKQALGFTDMHIYSFKWHVVKIFESVGKTKDEELQSFNASALYGYLDLAIIGEVSQGGHNLGHCSSKGLLYGLLLPLCDSGEAW